MNYQSLIEQLCKLFQELVKRLAVLGHGALGIGHGAFQEVWEVWEDGEEIFPPTLPTLPTLPHLPLPPSPVCLPFSFWGNVVNNGLNVF
ncbi:MULTISPECIES: hypothetical protein [Nostoc]|uniref:Uncharacterized protein n=1 Tax=Nostoc paludosum FACHB-159 TaxID=2692908 RepID=A0ABR8KFW6_9NOSO|nr:MULTISPECIES: hypothetical protein [Nostoc]MBD2736972.1 hypothetical protein [Nostoc paludosum FACHB-159]